MLEFRALLQKRDLCASEAGEKRSDEDAKRRSKFVEERMEGSLDT
jgi:hypothetical protein